MKINFVIACFIELIIISEKLNAKNRKIVEFKPVNINCFWDRYSDTLQIYNFDFGKKIYQNAITNYAKHFYKNKTKTIINNGIFYSDSNFISRGYLINYWNDDINFCYYNFPIKLKEVLCGFEFVSELKNQKLLRSKPVVYYSLYDPNISRIRIEEMFPDSLIKLSSVDSAKIDTFLSHYNFIVPFPKKKSYYMKWIYKNGVNNFYNKYQNLLYSSDTILKVMGNDTIGYFIFKNETSFYYFNNYSENLIGPIKVDPFFCNLNNVELISRIPLKLRFSERKFYKEFNLSVDFLPATKKIITNKKDELNANRNLSTIDVNSISKNYNLLIGLLFICICVWLGYLVFFQK